MRALSLILLLGLALLGRIRSATGQVFDSGRLLATSGVTQIEGSGGGGLVPWALIAGYGTRDGIGGDVHATSVWLPGYNLGAAGAAIGLFDRVELSYAHLLLDTRSTGGRLGLGRGYAFNEDVAGVKVRLFGNAVYDQDSWLPQVAAGAEFKSTGNQAVLHAIGAKSARGVDAYVAATKLFLAESLLVNATMRMTKANQFGLLGFGGDRHGAYRLTYEGSVAYLATRRLVVGTELRTRPDNLRFAHESPALDVFCAYFFNKNVSATLAYLGLGDVARQRSQNGVYVSLQAGF